MARASPAAAQGVGATPLQRGSGRDLPAFRRQEPGPARRAPLQEPVHPPRRGRAVGAGDRRRRQQGDAGALRGRRHAGKDGGARRGEDHRTTSRRSASIAARRATSPRCRGNSSRSMAARCRTTARRWKNFPASGGRPPMSSSTSPSASRPSPSTPTSSGSRTGPGSRPAATRPRSSRDSSGSSRIEYKLHAHHWLILHGRYICVARKPKCPECPINDICRYQDKTPPLR